MSPTEPSARVTLRTIRKWAREARAFPMLTCYDATTAGWLVRGGVRCLLVGDTAGQVILGHDSTLPTPMHFQLEITAGVRRGAPDAFVMADMPFGSYQCGDDRAMRHAAKFLTHGLADAVKLEVDETFAPLVGRMAAAGIPVVAHLGSRPQHVRAQGGYRAAGRTPAQAEKLVATAARMIQQGASMLLIEAVPAEVSAAVVALANKGPEGVVPVIGCGAGPACHGHVIVLQDLLGMSAWQPPFAPPMADVGAKIQEAAERWAKLVESGQYLAGDHPYKMEK
ncbi:MAG: 3-methyl-2-oxobutanoate hydroxymethyltransferase [Planctomycetota bacterium]|nr:3-methyl-2-oxobutanoate hydroxymethyltransferase [Planctomycetota bacterium]